MRERTVCFTGHRNIPAEQYATVYHRLKDAIAGAIGRGYRYFGAGGALGFDTMAAQAVMEMKTFHSSDPGSALSFPDKPLEGTGSKGL